MTNTLLIILIYITGVFVSIAVATWLWRQENEYDTRIAAMLSIFSWMFIVSLLFMLIAFVVWNYIIKYPFVGFYNWCNKKFRK